jgi:hypothetical protein
MKYCPLCVKFMTECVPTAKQWSRECANFEAAEGQKLLAPEPDAKTPAENEMGG